MRIASIGIDLGKTTFHLVAFGGGATSCSSQEVLPRAAAGLCRQPAVVFNRPRGMHRVALFGHGATRAGTPGTAPPAQFVKPYRKSNKNDFLSRTSVLATRPAIRKPLYRCKVRPASTGR